MFIINLVRSATDKFAPMTEHPRLVVGGIATATSLVTLSFLWAILPWGALPNLIFTLLAAATFVVTIEVAHRAIVRRKARKAAIEATEEPPPPLADPADVTPTGDGSESNDPDAPTEPLPATKDPGSKLPTYDPEKWPQYSDWLSSLDPEERHDLYITEQLVQSHHDLARASMLDDDEDETIYWKERPHIKYLIKRIWWRIPLAAIGAGGVCYLTFRAIGYFHWNSWLALIPVIAILWFMWYCVKRWYKWYGLYLIIQGNWFIIQKAKKWWLGLYGKAAKDQEVPLISCNNAEVYETFWESIPIPPWKKDARPLFLSGRIDINTSISDHDRNSPFDALNSGEMNDQFRDLKDVKRHRELARMIKQKHDRLIAGKPVAMRTIQSNP